MYQIMVKVPKFNKNVNLNDVHRRLLEINPRIGEIYIENDQYAGFGFMQADDDITTFAPFIKKTPGQNRGNILTLSMKSPGLAPGIQKSFQLSAELEVSAMPLPGSNSDVLEALSDGDFND